MRKNGESPQSHREKNQEKATTESPRHRETKNISGENCSIVGDTNTSNETNQSELKIWNKVWASIQFVTLRTRLEVTLA